MLFGALNTEGPFGMGWLKPSALFGIESQPLVHGVFASLAANVLFFVGVSLSRPPNAIEKLQADVFLEPDAAAAAAPFRFWRAPITIDDLRQTVARYLGAERTDAAFRSFAATRGAAVTGRDEVDAQAMRFAEHLLASAIGASSSRLVLSLLLKRRNLSTSAALQVVDEASAAVQQNRALLQHALDHAQQGVTVFDRDLRLLACNQAFRDLFDLPADLTQPGTPLGEIIVHNAERGLYGDDIGEDIVSTRIHSLVYETAPVRLRLPARGVVIDIRSNNLPDGGRITTYTDITESVAAEEALERANETLERRVRERTEELVRVNAALSRAKGEADEANLSKTRFLAAASHDILQPLNAARLYTSSLVERVTGEEARSLAANADSALDSVEEILTALLDISRLDSGAMKPDIGVVAINDIFRQLSVEFEPIAAAKDLRLTFMPCSLSVRSDRRLLRRLLQNLVSNAIKYTPSGRVLVGCRRRKGRLRIEVRDTGIGIPANRQKQVFREFQRLDQGAMIARGLGLGLSIVERIAKALDHRISLESTPGKGTAFLIDLPAAPAAVRKAEPAAGASPGSGLARQRAHRPVHRQRGADPRGHAGAAVGMGLRGADGAGRRPGGAAAEGPRRAARRDRGGLPPRQGRRAQRHPNAAARLRRRSEGGASDGGPLGRTQGQSGEARGRRAEQAAEAGRAQGLAQPGRSAASGGGIGRPLTFRDGGTLTIRRNPALSRPSSSISERLTMDFVNLRKSRVSIKERRGGGPETVVHT